MPVLFSRACEYALRGLAEMAGEPDREQWRIHELSQRTNTPAPFLAKTFQTLVKSGILNSTKGRGGGFTFARPVDDIYLIEVVRCVDGPTLGEDCVLGFPKCNDENPCPFHDRWKVLRSSIIDALSSQTLKEFAQS